MKITKIVSRTFATILLVGVSHAAWAEDGYYYAGVQGGLASTSMDSSQLNTLLQQRGHAGIRATVDEDSPSGGIYAGYRFNAVAGVQLGYTYAGEFETNVSGTAANPSQLADDLLDLLRGSGHGLTLDLDFRLPLAGSVYFNPTFGAYGWMTEISIQNAGATTKKTKTGLGGKLGLGFGVMLPMGWNAGVGYDLLLPSSDHQIGAVVLKVSHDF